MRTHTQQVVNKAWNFAHVLRVNGLSYMVHVEQIAFLLFLKMGAFGPGMPGTIGIGTVVEDGKQPCSVLPPLLPLLFLTESAPSRDSGARELEVMPAALVK